MKTGAEEDSLSTPILAFSASSARAVPIAVIAIRPASASRTIPIISFTPPSLSCNRLKAFAHGLVPSDEGALLLQRFLQLFNRDVTRDPVSGERQRSGGTGGLPHHETGTGDPGRRLALMGHRGAAAGDQQIVDAFGHQHPVRQLVIAARFRDRREGEDDVAGDMGLDRPAIDPDGILERSAAEHVLTAELIAAIDAAGFADAELRRQVDDVGFFKARHGAQEFERSQRLLAALDLAAGEIVRLDAVDGMAVLARYLRKIYPPFDAGLLRPHDRALARECVGAGGGGLLHQLRNGPPGFACPLRVDVVETEHHRGIHRMTVLVAEFERRAGPNREIAVAGAIDEDLRSHRLPAGLGLDH